MMRMRLSPLKKKAMKDRENKFVLDCTNCCSSKLPNYNSLKDQYLKYYVIRVSKKKYKNVQGVTATYNNRQDPRSSMNKTEFD